MDLTLSYSFRWQESAQDTITLREAVPHKHVQKDKFVLKPNHFVLASTAESISVPHNMADYIGGCSSIGRLGLQVQNVEFIDADFHGK